PILSAIDLKLGDPGSCCSRHYRDSHCKNVRQSNGIWKSCTDTDHERMSDPVHLKNMLRQVQSDRSNLAHGWLPFAADSNRQQFGTQMPQGGHPPHHSITSSATASSLSGTVRPSIVAVWALITSSNLLDCTTGKSAGLAPLG